MKKKLNTAEKLKDIENSYFVRMMLPDATKRAWLYIEEEKANLVQLISNTPHMNLMNFIVVGAGTLWYVETVYDLVKRYIAVEPLADIFIQKQIYFLLTKHNNIKVINKELGKFGKKELPNNNSIFVFHFNILAYISDPIGNINKYLNRGDIIYISSWNSSVKAKSMRKDYFDYLNLSLPNSLFKIDPEKTVGLCDLDSFPFKKLKYYKRHQRIKGEIADILIIHC